MGELRKNFGRIKRILEIPNLIDIQTQSYAKFLQRDIDPERTADEIAANVVALETPINETVLHEVQAALAPVMGVTWPSGNWKS